MGVSERPKSEYSIASLGNSSTCLTHPIPSLASSSICHDAIPIISTEKFIKKDFNEKILPSSIKSGAVGFMNPSPNARPNPTYREVCSGSTGYVETYDCEFDGKPETFEKLVKHFFTFHDPTTLNRQGNDAGTQYGSVIFCYDQAQQEIANKVKAELQALIDGGKVRAYQNKQVTTQVVAATKFYAAQDDHQMYLEKNPWGYCNRKSHPSSSSPNNPIFVHPMKIEVA